MNGWAVTLLEVGFVVASTAPVWVPALAAVLVAALCWRLAPDRCRALLRTLSGRAWTWSRTRPGGRGSSLPTWEDTSPDTSGGGSGGTSGGSGGGDG